MQMEWFSIQYWLVWYNGLLTGHMVYSYAALPAGPVCWYVIRGSNIPAVLTTEFDTWLPAGMIYLFQDGNDFTLA